jgi:hypothetical protein
MDFDEEYVAQIIQAVCENPRPVGSHWNSVVRQMLIDRYRLLGYDVDLQESEFTGWQLDKWPQVEYTSPIEKPVPDCLPVVWSGSIEEDEPINGIVLSNVEGVPAKIKTFEAYEWNCFPVVDEKGILRVVLLSNERDDRLVWPQPRDNDLDHVPYILIGTTEGIFIQQCLQANVPVRVRVSVKAQYLPRQKLYNILAQQSTNPSIIVGAHYDSFFHTQGAHDNASGTACLLYLARILAESPIPKVRLASFDAEEWNKLGAYRFVESLTAEQISNIERMINIDSVGVGDRIYLLTSPEQKESLATAVRKSGFSYEFEDSQPVVSSPENEADYPKVLIRVLERFPQFDSWPFMQKGIRVCQVGTIGAKPFPFWHDPRDTWSLIGSDGYRLIAAAAQLVYGLLKNWE